MSGSWPLIVTVLATVITAADLRADDRLRDPHPLVRIVVTQEKGVVTFTAWRERSRGTGKFGPGGVLRLAVAPDADERATLWEIVAPGGHAGAPRVVYAQLPEGFVQRVPAAGGALPLVPRTRYRVSVEAPWKAADSFTYLGP